MLITFVPQNVPRFIFIPIFVKQSTKERKAMPVKLRENVKKSGTRSLYLDITHSGKRYKEYLGISLKPARTPMDRLQNKELKRIASEIRAKREIELIENDYRIAPAHKKAINFMNYYQKFVDTYTHRDYRIVKYSLQWFIKYMDFLGIHFIKPKDITPDHCQGYYDYMKAGGLRGETPYNYFTKFKRVLRKAMKERLIIDNPADEVDVTRSGGIKKDILSYSELQLLAKAKCTNAEVKRAFLFCCYSGLRWCDAKELTHRNIDRAAGYLIFRQSKTEHSTEKSQVSIDLNNNLLKLIGEPGKPDQKIFNLPSFTGALKALRGAVENAGITKHITWHSARHSFAVNTLGDGNDVKTVADLMGHSSIKHTEKYLHVVDARKQAAMKKQPEVDISE
jgi:integrase/recombinase XerD